MGMTKTYPLAIVLDLSWSPVPRWLTKPSPLEHQTLLVQYTATYIIICYLYSKLYINHFHIFPTTFKAGYQENDSVAMFHLFMVALIMSERRLTR